MWITTMSTYNLLLILLAAIATGSTSSDHYLLSCGTTSSVSNTPSTYDYRTWYSDNNSTFSNDFSSTTVAAAASDVNIPQIPFSTARIFTSNFTYSFPVSPGPKFIRLFFYPSSNSSSSDSYLTVESNTGHLLLRNFSAYLATSSYMFKEFYVHVNASLLQLTFAPTSPSPHAFLNGIEIVSVPENLYVGPTAPKYIASPYVEVDLITNSTALETAYRLNVGGSDVGSEEDSGFMYRQWENDDKYLIGDLYGRPGFLDNQTLIKYTAVTPNYSAPVMVYETFRFMGISNISNEQRMNLTWGFEVDLGFNYLLRLHWCEDDVEVNATGYRVFDVYIDQLTAEDGFDVFERVGGYTAMYRDYVVYYMDAATGNGTMGVLQLAMHPSTTLHPEYLDVLLNGLEIFKLSRPDGSLDAPNPDRPRIPAPNQQPPPKSPFHTNVLIITGSVVGSILLALLALVVYYLFVRRGRCCFLESADPNSNTSSSKKTLITIRTKTGISSSSSSSSSPQCRIFMLSDIKSATSDFCDASIIGKGGFGIVYGGTLDGPDHGPVKVAIKRLKPSSKQGNNEFRTEIEMLSNLRHEHLVGLIGYCDEQGEMILVYEYMQSGTLCDRLYDTDSSPLSWNQRLQVCVGAAMGLHYLHEGGKHKIIHRDIKSSNILLDDRLVAKVSDFGLSRVGPMSEGLDHISTRVKGSLGYVDPEYIRRRQLTEKSDVYSLGVVLFEVLCGRPAVNPNLPKEQMNLAIWARSHKKRGSLEDIVDPNLKGQIEPECLRMFGEIAERCVRNNGIDRPSAAELLQALLDICLKEAKNDGEKA